MKLVCATATVVLLAVLSLTICSKAQSTTPVQSLQQYVAALQRNPEDTALREKIIQLVQTMKPEPTIPKKADKLQRRAALAVNDAKTEADFADAAKQYEKALLIAPWVPAYYFNLGAVQEKAGKLEDARRSFEFCLLAAPSADNVTEVHYRIERLRYLIERAQTRCCRQQDR